MSERTLVPIFLVWALLTIITPTLILLSENSKADINLNGNYISEGMKVRRMFGYTQNNIIRTLPQPLPKSVMVEEELASTPAPEPTPSLETSTRPNSLHNNHTLMTKLNKQVVDENTH
ncbi:hypothetical protein TanjilG_09758 [Lupinus angustifolius]|uniref:Uncharacterized protein n=1 Tax=Lupinus angustifolius TaxID=3871 RepID=A0A4P1QW96_LUPAN|nr:PREDICTED: uncharacterized protein LOC109327959 [Lupinus angustifolius]OIV96331.1 hypothetical protein TanjilG_09758 [Lupinus angustifolius]